MMRKRIGKVKKITKGGKKTRKNGGKEERKTRCKSSGRGEIITFSG